MWDWIRLLQVTSVFTNSGCTITLVNGTVMPLLFWLVVSFFSSMAQGTHVLWIQWWYILEDCLWLWLRLYYTLNLDIDYAAVNALSIVVPPHTSAYTYCFRVWLNVQNLKLNWTSYLDETLTNCELHPWNLMPWYKQNMSWKLVHQLHSKLPILITKY